MEPTTNSVAGIKAEVVFERESEAAEFKERDDEYETEDGGAWKSLGVTSYVLP
ncbi:hypothetical protein AALP_AA3G034100 [Arabis alpina]|uniref:Uncharacterized protein n=1 Tax=Arabis alpina TaxID=50452 RepID=A0A087H6S3_ARAAL|nr:hypothetical protein AALP_AA3G034100 [Arabis alpina]